jgi:hypothetical protein
METSTIVTIWLTLGLSAITILLVRVIIESTKDYNKQEDRMFVIGVMFVIFGIFGFSYFLLQIIKAVFGYGWF